MRRRRTRKSSNPLGRTTTLSALSALSALCVLGLSACGAEQAGDKDKGAAALTAAAHPRQRLPH
ncbi:hypothetical protein HLK59_45040, partial [Streptomyces sp. S3(2020)]|uniref:hypothetical protein n=1 Tax=Streptomyces sp. S3(2020) TaxID=2732044 RepID=UPI001487ADB0